mgnify:CR=1 FL=1
MTRNDAIRLAVRCINAQLEQLKRHIGAIGFARAAVAVGDDWRSQWQLLKVVDGQLWPPREGNCALDMSQLKGLPGSSIQYKQAGSIVHELLEFLHADARDFFR